MASVTSNELAILAAVLHQPCYGYALADEVKRITKNKIVISVAGLYTTLVRMELKGLIQSRWSEDKGLGARRRYYQATKAGRKLASDTLAMLEGALKP